MVELELLEPFSVIQYLWQTVGVEITPEAVSQWWGHHRKYGAPWAVYSCASSEHIPLALYGDAARTRQVPYGPPEKVLGLFLSCPLFRPKSARASRWLIFSIDEYLLYKHKTFACVLARVTWSLNALFEGKFPSCGPEGQVLSGTAAARAGQPICGGAKFSVCQLRGDWAYHKEVFRLRSSWASGTNQPVCFLCPAMSRGRRRYYNLDESGDLWSEQYSFCDFLCNQIPMSKPCSLPCSFHQGGFDFDGLGCAVVYTFGLRSIWIELRPPTGTTWISSHDDPLRYDACVESGFALWSKWLFTAPCMRLKLVYASTHVRSGLSRFANMPCHT